MTVCRGVRGATTVDENTREAILRATRELLAVMIRRNDIHAAEVASAIFTTTSDLNAEFPALAARQLGWMDVPLLCAHEINVPSALSMCIRILINWNTEKQQHDVHHVYLHDAVKLRPDLINPPPVDLRELEEWISRHLDPDQR